MPDREKVIEGLEHCVKEADCRGCVYFEQMKDQYDGYKCDCNKDALALLKEQEPVEPYADFDGHDVWRCGNCGAAIFHFHNDESDEDEKVFSKFCTHCGKPVRWE